MAENPWSWLRCERTNWQDRDDESLRYYIGHFRFDVGARRWFEVQVPFMARKPYVAMRQILQELSTITMEDFRKGIRDPNRVIN
jgi:hypothetical protein